jgi:hypothetical protein
VWLPPEELIHLLGGLRVPTGEPSGEAGESGPPASTRHIGRERFPDYRCEAFTLTACELPGSAEELIVQKDRGTAHGIYITSNVLQPQVAGVPVLRCDGSESA